MIGHALNKRKSESLHRLVTMCGSLDGKRMPSRREMASNFIATFDEDVTCRECLRTMEYEALPVDWPNRGGANG